MRLLSDTTLGHSTLACRMQHIIHRGEMPDHDDALQRCRLRYVVHSHHRMLDTFLIPPIFITSLITLPSFAKSFRPIIHHPSPTTHTPLHLPLFTSISAQSQ